LREIANNPELTYNNIKNRKGVISYEKYSNEVPFGEKPILIEKGGIEVTSVKLSPN